MGMVIARSAQIAGFVSPPAPATYITVLAASNIPDIDVLFYGLSPRHHVKSLLHKPLFWCALLVLLTVFRLISGIPIPGTDIALVGISLFMHFILDTGNYTEGVQWLWPFSDKVFHFFPFVERPKKFIHRLHAYRKSPTFVWETTLWVVFFPYIFLFR